MEAPTFLSLLYALDGEGIATITLNRPDALNAISKHVVGELRDAFDHARTDDAVKGVIITGTGDRAFAAGADVSEFVGLTPSEGHQIAVNGQAVFSQIEAMPKPVVAAVNGFALGGGCELAMACHLRVASEKAQFGQPEVNLGLIPGYGGTQRLPRLVGRGVAMDLLLTGLRISAQRAYEIGLVNRVAAPDAVMSVARDLLLKILGKAPLAVGFVLQALRTLDDPIATGLAEEATLFGQCFATEDAAEGVGAFLERRTAMFTGR